MNARSCMHSVVSSSRRRFGFSRITGLLLLMVATLCNSNALAQGAKGIDDTWQGTLHAGEKDLRTVLKISKDDKGGLKGTFYSIDQGGQPIPTTASFADGTLKIGIQMLDLTFEGKLSADGNSVNGTVTQGGKPLPLLLVRATPATAWTIPEPPKAIPPMPAEAKPTFEVVTIKPSKPDQQGMGFTFRGGTFLTINTPLVDIIKFAYGVQEKQILGLPDWATTEKYDLTGRPDITGMPNSEQTRQMIRQVLAERFGLKFHEDKKELSAYVLTVAKGGPKMEDAGKDGGPLPGLFFRGLGILTVRNATMKDFSELMQEAVLDRPVVDQTGLTAKYNFLLKWTPDESQFGGMHIKVPPPTDTTDAPPPLYTAITEQIGLKLDAAKAPVKVMVIDHAEKPSAN